MFETGNRGRLAFAAAILTLPAGRDGKSRNGHSGGVAASGHSALHNKQGDYVVAYALS